ncbi:Fe(3+)-hydroxamate ABC transporter permease FhuB [Ancylobacter dichloromethanicus]|uniref:Fe3+-hydroxamate ABC transporter permease FhuB n=1 Tax=Ancylobacter dichloromethanicus TaxID=518825 RepID=A0A9W6N1B2_9HYPH|nr:Fe(3+)-hydroxamate ABC transporter permease FhuB [Ancylobacter dichloromethanicus]MBS7552125.1 Fe(3+)-hydroxamate ABC transporter permease FhuB [Ancylobacter dichloromethanicus]GLK73857.1 Fe3+-hydroxamate ABC transporter permease FhuB [Ancylobacter dichloromethanicus]
MADITAAFAGAARPRLGPVLPVLLLAAPALAASLVNLSIQLPPERWWATLAGHGLDDTAVILALYSFAPRLVVSLLAGGALGLAGALLQQVLRNPIASPTTLGLEAGATLALAATLVGAPALVGLGREWVALGGGLLAIALVLALSRRSGFAPLVVILAGMVAGLACAALAALLALFNSHYLAGLFLWGAGSLSQQDWSAPAFLAPRLALAGLAAALLLRPLTLLGLDDGAARSLGLSLALARFAALAVAVALTAFVVAGVGSLGFIGLAAPVLARIGGARRVGARLLAAALIGAALLWLTDQMVQLLSGVTGAMLPTGAVTAMFGAPLLLWMVPRLRLPPQVGAGLVAHATGLVRPLPLLAGLALLLAVAALASAALGPGGGGWTLSGPADPVWALRAPRILAAMAGGTLLAVAGGILQRMTGNPMASSEVLGVSAGAACGLVVAMFAFDVVGRAGQTLAATLGALVALVGILALARASKGAPERVILAGVAIGALLDSLVSLLMASGDPRAVLLFNWMTGSTYGIDLSSATISLAAAGLALAALPLVARWLDILPLGGVSARAVGMPSFLSRSLLLALAALATAMATLLVGPLSFVGLIAPPLARLAGLRRPLAELIGAALLGSLIMVGADFIGRTIAFPWQLPAGLVACMIGAPAFLWLLTHKQAAP